MNLESLRTCFDEGKVRGQAYGGVKGTVLLTPFPFIEIRGILFDTPYFHLYISTASNPHNSPVGLT